MSAFAARLSIALAAALIYALTAAAIVRQDRNSRASGFITLPGMGSYLATLPVALPAELAGCKIDFRSNWQIGAAILACAILVGGVVLGLVCLIARLPWLHQHSV